MPCEHEYKCGPLKDLEKRIDEKLSDLEKTCDDHETRIRPIETSNAVIKAKMTAILWVCSATGAAVIGGAVTLIFKLVVG